MSPKLAPRFDAEDVVQSTYRTFFHRAKRGEFELKQGGDLWKLLAAISMRKLHKQIDRNLAGKRSLRSENDGQAALSMPSEVADLDSWTPDEEVAIQEEVDFLLAALDPQQQSMLQMRLAGYLIEEIAVVHERTERTVRRVLEKVKSHLLERAMRRLD